MFSLIITLISVVIVTALALHTLYESGWVRRTLRDELADSLRAHFEAERACPPKPYYRQRQRWA